MCVFNNENLAKAEWSNHDLDQLSQSPGVAPPSILRNMLENAVRICDARFGNIYRWDGDALRLAATYNTPPAFAELRRNQPFRPGPKTPTGRMVATKSVTHVADLAQERGYLERDPLFVGGVELGGIRKRRLILKLLAARAIQMDTNGGLRVRSRAGGDKFIWELHRWPFSAGEVFGSCLLVTRRGQSLGK